MNENLFFGPDYRKNNRFATTGKKLFIFVPLLQKDRHTFISMHFINILYQSIILFTLSFEYLIQFLINKKSNMFKQTYGLSGNEYRECSIKDNPTLKELYLFFILGVCRWPLPNSTLGQLSGYILNCCEHYLCYPSCQISRQS